MLGWFSPRCPLGTWEKTWTEVRMRWLAEQFGIDQLLGAPVVTPTEEFFPDPYDGDAAGARRLLDFLCGFMGVAPGSVSLEVCADVQLPGAAGHYDPSGRKTIRVAESQLGDPERLLATLAHELAHEILLGRKLLDPNAPDHELVTDLLPVFLGVGLFAANATVRASAGFSGGWSWWQVARQGYLPSRVFGYALALFAFARGEDDPAWAVHLRPDAASPLREGLRYLRKTEDTLFHPDTAGRPRGPAGPAELLLRLRQGRASARLAALWELREQAVATADAAEAVAACLADRDPDIPGEAARSLAVMGPVASGAVPLLIRALRSPRAATRAGAACALGAPGLQPDEAVAELCALLDDRDCAVVDEVMRALVAFGRRAEAASAQLLGLLSEALIECDHPRAALVASTLLAVVPDPGRRVREFFAHDSELRKQAVVVLREEKQTRSAPAATTPAQEEAGGASPVG